jgi:hypothetical protein
VTRILVVGSPTWPKKNFTDAGAVSRTAKELAKHWGDSEVLHTAGVLEAEFARQWLAAGGRKAVRIPSAIVQMRDDPPDMLLVFLADRYQPALAALHAAERHTEAFVLVTVVVPEGDPFPQPTGDTASETGPAHLAKIAKGGLPAGDVPAQRPSSDRVTYRRRSTSGRPR